VSLRDKLRSDPLLPLYLIRSKILRGLVYPRMWKRGTNVLNEDWNCLIILDACRYDVFERIYEDYINFGELEKRISLGTETTSFLLRNFGDGYHDIVYVTANPFVDELLSKNLFKIVPVWKFGWNGNTVHPKTLYKYAVRTMAKYEGKRMVVHFIQPHFPFIPIKIEDETFDELRRAVIEGREPRIRNRKKRLDRISSLDLYVKSDVAKLKKAYEANLKVTLPYVARLMRLVRGRVVVTADHGEAFGEKLHNLIPIRVYGHPKDVPIKELLEVPWLVYDNDDPLDLNKEIARLGGNRIRKTVKKIRKRL